MYGCFQQEYVELNEPPCGSMPVHMEHKRSSWSSSVNYPGCRFLMVISTPASHWELGL